MTAPDPVQPLGTLIANSHGNWIAGDAYAAPAHLLGQRDRYASAQPS